MRPLRKIAFLVEDFTAPSAIQNSGSAAQQLVDRFLIGYPRDGVFRTFNDLQVTVHLLVGSEADFSSRVRDHRLLLAQTAEQAVADADAVVIVPRWLGVANDGYLRAAVEHAPEGSTCFVHGLLSNSVAQARILYRVADARKISVLAGTPTSITWRLPDVDLASGTKLNEALIIVQGTSPAAELNALEGLLPVLEKRQGGEHGIARVCRIEGADFWRAGKRGLWSEALLASAISRSHSPQGDPLLDGRTQDIFGLGLVPKLARNFYGWILEHNDGLRTALLVLNGVVADYNFAVRTGRESILSAQLFRPPSPIEHQYSRLVAAMEDFFTGKPAAWNRERNVLITELMEIFRQPKSRSGDWIDVKKQL